MACRMVQMRLNFEGHVCCYEWKKRVTRSLCICRASCWWSFTFYRALHYSAKCSFTIACRLSVCLSVCLWRWWIMTT